MCEHICTHIHTDSGINQEIFFCLTVDLKKMPQTFFSHTQTDKNICRLSILHTGVKKEGLGKNGPLIILVPFNSTICFKSKRAPLWPPSPKQEVGVTLSM